MKKIKTIIIIIVIMSAHAAFSITGDEALQKFKNYMAEIKTMKGNISLVYQTGEMYSGSFKYMFPGKIFVQFSEPSGKTIVSNGKKLWAYDAASSVCGVQELDIEVKEGDKDFDKNSTYKKIRIEDRGGPSVFLSGYRITTVTEENTGLTIELMNTNRKYTDVKLMLNSEFMLIKAVFKNDKDEGFMIKLSDVVNGEKIMPGLFDFNVPASAQIVKNPLDIR